MVWEKYSLLSLTGSLRACFSLGTLAVLAATFGVSKATANSPENNASDQYAFDGFGLEVGLPHTSTVTALQTRDGYLWAGTPGGLARFDGVRCVSYLVSNTPALKGNNVRHLYESKAGDLWVGTNRGIARLHEGVFEHMGLPDAYIRSIVEDRRGRFWAATDRFGLQFLENGRWETDKRVPSNASVRTLFVDSNDRLWVGFDGGTIALLPDGGTLRPPAAIPQGGVYTICEHPKGTLWFGTAFKGLYRLQGEVVSHYTRAEGLGDDSVYSLRPDRNGGLWVMSDSVLQRIADPERVSFRTINALKELALSEFIEDRESNLWICTRHGIVRLRKMPYQLFSAQSGLPGSQVKSVSADRAGNLWFAVQNSGPAKMAAGGGITVYDQKAGFPQAGPAVDAQVVQCATDGAVWIGYRGAALHVLRNGVVESFPEIRDVMGIYEDRRGGIWLGTAERGVFLYRDGRMATIETEPGVPIVSALTFGEGPDGTIYIGVRQKGFFQAKSGKATLLRSTNGPTLDFVRAIHVDHDGRIWLGMRDRGLVVQDGDRWISSDTLTEAVGAHVSTMVEDESGRLWLGTAFGIMWAWKSELLADALSGVRSPRLHLVGTNDNAHLLPIWWGGYPLGVETPDHKMLFATESGAALVDPNALFTNQVAPPVRIEAINVDGKPLHSSVHPEVPAGTRQIEIDYTALSLTQPSAVMFKYMLEGYDTRWVEARNRRMAHYTNLPPGPYTFRVQASNNDGVWNEQGTSLSFSIRPFFYQTRWFYGSVAVGLVGLVWGVYRQRTSALRRHNEELEKRIAERTAALAKSYEDIRASEYFYHSLVESLPQIIVRKDAESRFTYATSSFSELLDRPVEQIIGKSDADVYPEEKARRFRTDDLRVMETHQTLEYESVVEKGGQRRFLHVKKVPLYDRQNHPIGVQILFWDITGIREIEEKLKQAQRELLESSRLAGIAEMATGILHNLGNALNSVNTTATLAAARVRKSKITSVRKVAALLSEQNGNLAEFLTRDHRGQQLPAFLAKLGDHLALEQRDLLQDLDALQDNIDHIKELVAAQQQYARVSGITEVLPTAELVEFALRLNEATIKRHNIEVVRDFTAAPAIKVERQKAVQILSNLIANAKDAMKEGGRTDRVLVIGIRLSAEGRAQITISDNGVGIAPENLVRIFAFGFTTKKQGHGFGLHSSALAATELGGKLTATSAGLGHGATFVLEFPPAD